MSVLLKYIFFSSILVFSCDLQWFLMHSSNLISLVDSLRFAFLCFQPHASNWGGIGKESCDNRFAFQDSSLIAISEIRFWCIFKAFPRIASRCQKERLPSLPSWKKIARPHVFVYILTQKVTQNWIYISSKLLKLASQPVLV